MVEKIYCPVIQYYHLNLWLLIFNTQVQEYNNNMHNEKYD